MTNHAELCINHRVWPWPRLAIRRHARINPVLGICEHSTLLLSRFWHVYVDFTGMPLFVLNRRGGGAEVMGPDSIPIESIAIDPTTLDVVYDQHLRIKVGLTLNEDTEY